MKRLFDEHSLRKTRCLNGEWSFITDLNGKGESEGWALGLPKEAIKVIVPYIWNMESGLFHYVGKAWYQRTFTCTSNRIMIECLAVSGFAQVYVDGRLIVDHYGDFTAFTATAVVERGTHILTITADNTIDANSVPKKVTDWFRYGGIFRDVNLYELPSVALMDIWIEYQLSEDLKTAVVSPKLEISTDGAFTERISVEVDGVLRSELTVSEVKAGEYSYMLPDFRIDCIRLWEPESPALYTIRAFTSDDDLIDKIGFRIIEVDGCNIFLNHKKLFLKGINRHEEHPDWGFAMPPQLSKRDLEILKNAGVNCIRGSHYPNTKLFLDMADETGMLFWSEIPMWGFPDELLKEPVIRERGLRMHEEMTRQYFNHPSIIIWGIFNECDTAAVNGRSLCEQYNDLLKKNGGNRLTTFATNRFETDISLDVSDIISINKYVGWYGDDERWDQFLELVKRRLDALGLGNKPCVFSEFGAAGIYGYTSFDANKGTEEYQASIIEEVVRMCLEDPRICGTFVWQACDIRSEMELNRARSYNNKGIMNEYRRPKLSYYMLKKLYTQCR